MKIYETENKLENTEKGTKMEENSEKQEEKKKTKKGKKKKKAWPKVLIILAIVVVILVVAISSCMNNLTEAMNDLYSGEVTAQAYGKHDTSVYTEATGTVESQNVQTASVTSGKITALNVETGDCVKKGDILVTFDSTDIDNQITALESQASDAEKQQAKQMEIQRRSLASTKTSTNSEISDAAKAIDEAKQDYNDALDSYNQAVSARDQAKSEYDAAVTALETAEQKLSDAENAAGSTAEAGAATTEAAVTDGTTAGSTDGSAADGGSADGSAADSTDITALKAEVAAAEKTVAEKKAAYEAAEALLSDGSMKKAVDAAKQAYETATSAYNKTVTAANESVQNAEDQIELQELSNSSYSSTATELAKLYEEKDACTVKAEFDGIATIVNGYVGDTVAGTVVQIEDDTNLKVVLSVKEKDIVKMAEGQKVTFTSDTLSDIAAEGEVTKVYKFTAANSGSSAMSDAASSLSGSSSSSATYQVVTTVTSGADQLILGMSVKAKIMVTEGEAVYAVPYTAIVTPEDNATSYVYVAKSLGEEYDSMGLYQVEKVEVKKGQEGEYYTAIDASKLTPGDLVITTADDVTEGESVMITIAAPDED